MSEQNTAEEYRGHQIEVTWHYDRDCDPPWENEDGHGPVTEWTRRDKGPGEVVLCSDSNGRSKRFYNWHEAIKIAKRDGWDAPPYKTGTKGERAERAVKADFEWLRKWCNDLWCYMGRVVSVDGKEIDSLWGIDSESIDEYTKEAIADAKRQIDTEETERQWAESHEIATV